MRVIYPNCSQLTESVDYALWSNLSNDDKMLSLLDLLQDNEHDLFYNHDVDLPLEIQIIKQQLLGIIAMGDNVKVAIVWDEKAQGTNGGTFTSGAWRHRDLSTKSDPDNLVSLSGNSVTILQSGTYWVRASSPAHAVDRHQLRLLKNGVLLAMGTSEFASNASNSVSNKSIVTIIASLVINDVIKIEHQCQTSFGTYGFGVGDISNFGPEIYSIMEIIQLGV